MNKLLLVLVTAVHLIPHSFGVSPIGATALYAGAYGKLRIAWLVPLIPLFIGDVFGGFYDLTVMAFVYAGFALSALIGRLLLAARRNSRRYALAVVSAAVVFYLVSNFSIWLVGMFPPTVAGLISCYVNGLPYLGMAIIADAAYCLLLFGAHAMIEREQPETATA